MTRCSYIPPEGQSVIAIAKERGGTTNGDIQALVDRFGCRAEATRIIGRAGSTIIDAHACDDHVGHLLGDTPCAWVEPVGSAPPPGWDETPDVTIEIVRADAAPAADFGPAIILSQSPAAPPVIDLGENPTREQIEAAGLGAVSASYREALAAFGGTALDRAQRTATCDVARGIHVLGADAGAATTCQCGRPFSTFTPMPLPTPQTVGVARPVELRPADRPTDENTTCPATFGGSMHTYVPGAERCFCGKHTPPPYAVGDEVEWQPGPFGYDSCWTRGRVTSVIDELADHPEDGSFWVIRVDTAGERRFVGPAVALCLRRTTPAGHTVLRAR